MVPPLLFVYTLPAGIECPKSLQPGSNLEIFWRVRSTMGYNAFSVSPSPSFSPAWPESSIGGTAVDRMTHGVRWKTEITGA